jgi:threonyl-tRNA synthetase
LVGSGSGQDSHRDRCPEGIAAEALSRLRAAGIRAELDAGTRCWASRYAKPRWIRSPICSWQGIRRKELGGLNVRLRSGENLGVKSLDEIVLLILADCQEPFKRGGMRYNFCSQ